MENTLYDNPLNLAMRDAFVTLTDAIGKVNELVPVDASMVNMDCIFDSTNLVIRSPFMMAQFIMQNLSHGTSTVEAFNMDEKLYWLQVANEMGPDYLGKLRRVAAFMDKVEGF
jgi:hypothetical protein